MRRSLAFSSVLLGFSLCAAAAVPRSVPDLGHIRMDGRLREYRHGARLKKGPLDARVGWHADALYLGVRLKGVDGSSQGLLDVALHFPEAGVTSKAYTFQFRVMGTPLRSAIDGTPRFAEALLQSATHQDRHGLSFEVKIPIRAFPRFPAQGGLKLDLCLSWQDGAGQRFANCRDGAMKRPLLLPNALRRAARVHAPSEIVSLEPANGGWLGYGVLFYPKWIEADEAITVPVLERLLPGEALDAAAAHIGMDHQYELPDGRVLLSVLSGKDPYAVAGQCDPSHEMRLGLFLVKGHSAERVLDRPASNCTLGRASSVELDDQGRLTITYSNGGTSRFDWSENAFEHSGLG